MHILYANEAHYIDDVYTYIYIGIYIYTTHISIYLYSYQYICIHVHMSIHRHRVSLSVGRFIRRSINSFYLWSHKSKHFTQPKFKFLIGLEILMKRQMRGFC